MVWIPIRGIMAKKKKLFHQEAKGLLILSGCIVALLCLLSFFDQVPEKNWLGRAGYFVSMCLHYGFGYGAYLLIVYAGWIGWKLIGNNIPEHLGIKTVYFSIFLFSFCTLLNVFAQVGLLSDSWLSSRTLAHSISMQHPFPHHYVRFYFGGAPLYYLYYDLPLLNFKHLFANVGVVITFSILGIVSLILFTEASVLDLLKKGKNLVIKSFKLLKKGSLSFKSLSYVPSDNDCSYAKIEKSLQLTSKHMQTNPPKQELPKKTRPQALPHKLPILSPKPLLKSMGLAIKTEIPEEDKETYVDAEFNKSAAPKQEIHSYLDEKSKKAPSVPKQETSHYTGNYRQYRLPPLNLLTQAKAVDQPTLKKDLKKRADILEETLNSFGIDARVGQINCGPTITSFEVHPPIGVKVQKIKVLENDIALNLQAKSIRIIAPIPGKAAVGVEVPSLHAQEVGFKEMLSSYQKQNHRCKIPILLGKTVSGEDVMCDLTKMPHCIIAGATGSGKSVCINSIVLSIVMNARPDEIKLLLIDPKKVELSGYSNLPHMIAPVITEAHGAYAALQWLVKEMQSRYEILKNLGLRNIQAFNNRKIDAALEESLNIPIPKKMSFIVTIIDEFADLMMASSSDLETPIARIAQMARAIGIHLILATQRPSREVITGLIKANFPTRISFKVASRINSQIILDENGAETLLGNGDLLFLPPGSSQLLRAQGVYIRDEDINRVVSFILKQASTNYLIKSFDNMAESDLFGNESEAPRDSLYDKALTLILESKNASTTFLQRKLKIGYARAASLIDELESRGIISTQEGSKSRKVLVDSLKFSAKKELVE